MKIRKINEWWEKATRDERVAFLHEIKLPEDIATTEWTQMEQFIKNAICIRSA